MEKNACSLAGYFRMGGCVSVLGIEDWYWNAGTPRDEVERYFATFGDRWDWFRQERRLGDLVGGVWRTVELQDPLERFGMSFVKGVKTVKFADDRVVWRDTSEVKDIGPARTDIQGALDHVMQSYALGRFYESAIQALLEDAAGDGVRVVLAQVPLRKAYCEELDRRFPAMAPYVQARVAALATRSGNRVALFRAGTDLDIPDDRFYDYGHLTEDGVRRMSHVWSELLKTELELAAPRHP